MFEPSPKQLVFAYGSNMHEVDLAQWLVRNGYPGASIENLERATLADYRLVWNHYASARQGGAANVEPALGQSVPGLLQKVDALGLEALDAKEEHPLVYRRELLPLRLESGTELRAWVYRVTPERRSRGFVPPKRAYLNLLLESARRFDLPHLAELEALPTAD